MITIIVLITAVMFDITSAGCDAVENNIDYPGNDLDAGGLAGRVPGYLTEEECRQWCISSDECVGYTFVKSETTRDNCAVKKLWVESSRTTSSCCNSAKVTDTCRLTDGCDDVQNNIDYPGNDLHVGGYGGRVIGHLTEAECRSSCMANADCVGYTFVKSETTRDNCAVKQNWVEGSRTTSSCCNSARISDNCRSSSGCDLVQNDIDYPGNDLNAGGLYGRVPGHLTEAECRSWCISNEACVGYTYVKSETTQDNCAVKQSWVEGSRTASSCCNSAKITDTCRSSSVLAVLA